VTKSRWAQIIGAVLLIVMNLFQGKMNMDKSGEIEKLTSLLTAPEDMPAAIVASDGKVEVVYKDRVITKYVPTEGGVKFNAAEYQRTLAELDSLLALRGAGNAEGHTDTVVATTSTEPGLQVPAPAANDSIDIRIRMINGMLSDPYSSGLLTIKTWGLCARPQIGGGWNGTLSPYVGAKIFFWNRFGITAGVTNSQAGIGVTYRVDKWVKFLRNTEIMGLYGIPFQKDSGGLYAGLAVNL